MTAVSDALAVVTARSAELLAPCPWSPVTDRTPALADLEPEGWTEPDMAAWANEIAADEWMHAQLDPPSDVLAAEWADERSDSEQHAGEVRTRGSKVIDVMLAPLCALMWLADLTVRHDTSSSNERNGS